MTIDKMRPAVTIMLDKERHILVDMNALFNYEGLTGRGIGEINLKKMTDLRAMLWASLLHEDEALTLEQVSSMMKIDNVKNIGDSLLQAFTKAMPDAKGGAKKNAPLAGSTSGATVGIASNSPSPSSGI